MSNVELERAIAALVESEKAEATARAASRRARAQLDTAVMVDAVEQRAEAVADTVSGNNFMDRMNERALGHVWAEGLFDHQWDGMVFGAGAERWILGDGMGLGKTRTSIGWLDLVGARKVIVVALAEVASQFAGEVEELAPHRRVTLLTGRAGKARLRVLDEIKGMSDGVVVVNYELLHPRSDVLPALIAWHADTIVIDEAHALKARGAKKNLEALVLAQNIEGPSTQSLDHEALLDRYLTQRSVKHLCLITGTPILNSPEDIYPLLHLIDPLLFKSLAAFNRAFTVMNHAANRLEFKPGGLLRLKRLLSGFYIARSYEDAGIVLPDSTHRIVRVDIDAESYPGQRRVIDEVTRSARITLASGQTHDIMHILSVVLRRRQANVWPGGIQITDDNGDVVFSVGDDVQESAKLDAVVAEIERHAPQRQVVFSQFKSALAELERRLVGRGIRVARLDGDTGRGVRAEIRQDFYRPDDAPQWDVLLANYATGGVGLNLQGATVVHELDEQWNPGKRDQARARVHRVGQTRETEVLTYRVPASIDTYMANIIRGKERMVNSFTDAVLDRTSTVELLRAAAMS